MNTCKRLSGSFSDYVENAMLPEQRHALEAHLSACAPCRAEVVRLQNLRSTLSRLPQLQAPPDFDALLRARLRREGKHAAALAQRRPRLAIRFAAFAAAGVLAFFAMSSLLRQNAGLTPASTNAPLYQPLDRAAAAIPLTASILYTLDKFSPKQWPTPLPRKTQREGPVLADSTSANLGGLPHGPQNNRASLFSL